MRYILRFWQFRLICSFVSGKNPQESYGSKLNIMFGKPLLMTKLTRIAYREAYYMKKIVLFINKKCSHCFEIDQYLLNYKIPFEERDISEDAAAINLLIEMKILTVPVIFIDDNVVVGFNKNKINKLLKIN